MFRHQLKSSLRNLARRDAVRYINIIGLSVGLAPILLISWIIVSWHTTIAALKNPAEALRYEQD